MFSRDELAIAFADIFIQAPPPLEHGAFSGMAAEDSIEVYWAAKSAFRDALHFWVAAFRTYIESCYEFGNFADYFDLLRECHPDVQRDLEVGRLALCQRLSWDEYLAELADCPAPLARHLGLSDAAKFVGALLMVKEWNYVVLLVEFTNRYFYFSWSTGG